jgi:chromosome partitioning protein
MQKMIPTILVYPLATVYKWRIYNLGGNYMVAVVVSLINMKGGVGKTTVAFNLVWYAAHRRDKKVLLIDLDPQANASQYLMGPINYKNFLDANKPTIVDLFEQFTAPTILKKAPTPFDPKSVIVKIRAWTDGSQIDLLPSRLELAWTLKNPTSKEHLLATFISKIQGSYDLILIDCAPTESILTNAAYRSSRYVLVPVKPEFLAAIGIPLLIRSLSDFKIQFDNHKLEIAGILFNDADPQHTKKEHNQGRKDVKALATQEKWYVFDNEVRHSDSFPAGARTGSPIFATSYARWWVKDEFDKVGAEFMKRIGL